VFVRGATAGVGGTLTAAPEALAGGWRAQLERGYNEAGFQRPLQPLRGLQAATSGHLGHVKGRQRGAAVGYWRTCCCAPRPWTKRRGT
jgi:hypothetical protein